MSLSRSSANLEFPSSSLEPVEPMEKSELLNAARKSRRKSELVASERKSLEEKSTDPGGLDLRLRSFES